MSPSGSTEWTVAYGHAATPRPAPSAATTTRRAALPANRHPLSRVPGAGWSYQWVAQLGFSRDSWTAPVDVRRQVLHDPVHPYEYPSVVAIEQIKGILARGLPNGLAPLFVFDAGYDKPTQHLVGRLSCA